MSESDDHSEMLGPCPSDPYLCAAMTCVRCSSNSTSCLTYAYERREAWLVDSEGSILPGTRYPLCTTHADRVTPPLGWILHDRRSQPTLFAPGLA